MTIFNKLQNRYVSPFKTFSLKEKIGEGADGEVFLTNDNKVLKFSIYYSIDKMSAIKESCSILKKLDKLINEPMICFVSLYENNYLFDGEYKDKYYVIYSTLMERLNDLTYDENLAIRTIAPSLEENNPNISDNEVWDRLSKISDYYEFDKDKIYLFYNCYLNCKYNHNDFHSRNIMKNNNGFYKLVDLDRVTYKKKEV